MKTIVIPAQPNADFSHLAKTMMSLYETESLRCIFLEMRLLPDNYNDLLTLSSKNKYSTLGNTAFRQAEANFKNLGNDRIKLEEDYLYGDSALVFKNYVLHREADLVVYDERQWSHSSRTGGLNIFRMVSRCGAELMYLSGEPAREADETVVRQYRMQKRMPAKPEVQSGVPARATYNLPEDAPQSVHYQFQAVDALLNELQHSLFKSRILSKKINNLSRYFLKESTLQKLLAKSDCSMLLIQK